MGVWWYWRLRSAMLFLQAFLGTIVFAHALPPRKTFLIRFVGSAVGGFLLTAGADIWLRYGLGLPYRPIFMMECLLLAGVVGLCWRTDVWTAVLVASNGYLAQHMGGSVKTILRTLFPLVNGWLQNSLGLLAVDVLCYGLTDLILLRFLHPSQQDMDALDHKTQTAFSLMILFLCVGMSHITKTVEGLADVFLSDELYAIIGGALLLFLQFNVSRRLILTQGMEAMRQIMRQQQLQYEQSRENIQVMNERYHDIKQILANVWDLEEFRRRLTDYDASLQTGSEVLDVLLMEKQTACRRQGIAITSQVGGVDLSFMEELDLYALVNNALTNAMEAVAQLPEERYIHMSAQREQNMVTIHVENPCVGVIPFQDGLPQSGRDRRYHGFGMKSMERIAEKYGGALSAVQENGQFLLDVVLFAGPVTM